MVNVTTLAPDVTQKNNTNDIFKDSFDFKNNPGLVFVTIACVCTSLWLLFITFYFSRCVAFLVTKLLNWLYVKDGYLHIGKHFQHFDITFTHLSFKTKPLFRTCLGDFLAILFIQKP